MDLMLLRLLLGCLMRLNAWTDGSLVLGLGHRCFLLWCWVLTLISLTDCWGERRWGRVDRVPSRW